MRGHPLYIKLTEIINKGGLTIDGVKRMTKAQAEILVQKSMTKNFALSLKKCLLEDMQVGIDEQIALAVKDKVKAFLEQHFPNYAITRGREGTKPYVTIWLEGVS